MRTLLLATLPLALGLGACATDPITGQPEVVVPIPSVIATNPSVTNVVTQAQDIAVRVCGYLPTAETVANIVTTFTGTPPGLDLATTIADQICAAVTKQGVRRGATAVPMVNGVPIQGRFVASHRHDHRR